MHIAYTQGRTEKLKREGSSLTWGGEVWANFEKNIYSFGEILKKFPKRGGGKDLRPTLCTLMHMHNYTYSNIFV